MNNVFAQNYTLYIIIVFQYTWVIIIFAATGLHVKAATYNQALQRQSCELQRARPSQAGMQLVAHPGGGCCLTEEATTGFFRVIQ
jgi:hypothetical protein